MAWGIFATAFLLGLPIAGSAPVQLPRPPGLAGETAPISQPVEWVAGPAHEVGSGSAGRPDSPMPAVVNPYLFESDEPAAIGVADYGLTASGVAYNYSTPEFVGTASIGSVAVASSGGAGKLLGIQLNLVLSLGPTGHPYVYWVRFAPWVNASTDVLTLQNEVFNLTSTSTDNPSPISGRGAINTAEADQYQYTPPCSSSYPGNCAALSFPALMQLRAVSQDVDGVPGLAIAYNLGRGWISEDNISFPSLSGLADRDFVVNGSGYTPTGLFYDAEFVLGGPYHGYTQTNLGSTIQLSLDEFNGHNLQVVPNAWNFGAESSNRFQNASTVVSAANASPADQVGAGSGKLGRLYSTSNESTVTVVGVPTSGVLTVDGSPLNYSGGEAVVELAPGRVALQLVSNGSVLASRNVTLTAGEVTTISMNAFYPIEIEEAGLPPGANWSIDWAGEILSSNLSHLVILALNGSYTLRVENVTGFTCNFTVEPVRVLGPGVVRLGWSPFLFVVPFDETGLTSGTSWWVTMDNQTARGVGPTLNVSAGNGSYAFTVGAPYAFVPWSATGNVSVDGPPGPVQVGFNYRLSFLAGSVRPSAAIVSIGGSSVAVDSGTFNDSVLPGTYFVSVSDLGYVTWSRNVTTTPGNTTELAIALNATPSAEKLSPESAPGPDWTLVEVASVTAVATVVGVAIILLRRRSTGPGSR